MHMYMETPIDVRLCSLNVRGLRNALKRRCVFNWIRNSDYHLILLQETHSTPDIECFWRNEWGFKIEFSHGSSAIVLAFVFYLNHRYLLKF